MSSCKLGISSFAENVDGVALHLAPLLEHARTQIPPSLQPDTPIFLLATAGMRLLDKEKQTAVLDAACDVIRFHSHFRVDPSSTGPCGSNVRIISGEEEGLFGWIAVNYLMDQFTKRDDDQTTYGFLDMGGASTQIAFEPSAEERKKTKGLVDVRLRLIGGEEIHHGVFVTTWLGYGTNQARSRYVERVISQHETSISVDGANQHGPVSDPCLPRNLRLDELSTYPGHEDPHSKMLHTLIGTGSFEQCLENVEPLLNKDAPCPDVPCLFNGVHVPHIDFSVSRFIGVSEYWYSSEHVFGLGGPYNVVEYERAAANFCSQDWQDIMAHHELSKSKDALGGDGEMEEDGRIVGIGKWGDVVEIPRLQMQCFKSAWLINVLHEGIGMPRIVDAGGNSTGNLDAVEGKASEKGLGKPIMQSVDTIGDTAISWTLGKMVLEASREVPPLSKDVPPLSDPVAGDHGDVPVAESGSNQESTEFFPPKILGGYQLDFTLLGTLWYLVSLSVIVVLTFRFRRQIAHCVRRIARNSSRRPEFDLNGRVSLEDGYQPDGVQGTLFQTFTFVSRLFSASRHLASMRSGLSRILSSIRPRPATPPSSALNILRHTQATAPASPVRSFSSASLKSQNGSAGTGYHAGIFPGSSLPSRSSTPPAYRRDVVQSTAHTSQSLHSLPRSRNNSQLNLTTLTTRQLSRGGSSGQQTPTGTFHDGD